LRIELPQLDEVPGPEEVANNPALDRWTLPHTEITLHRVAQGPRIGEFLFSPETVKRAQEFYERTQALPYRREPPIEGTTSFLEVYGNWNIPISWVDALPSFMRRVFWGQALWKWVALLTAILLSLAVILGVYSMTKGEGQVRSVGQYLRRLLVPVLLLVASVFVLPALSDEILLIGHVATYLQLGATAIAYLSLAWVAWILIVAVGEFLVNRPRIHAESLDASLIRLTARIIAIIVAVLLVFQGATAIGIPLVGLVASVSIGGLAVALAAQDTLKSLLGSLMIFIDKPYQVGELTQAIARGLGRG